MDEPVGRLQCNLRMQLSSLSTAVQPLWLGIAVNPLDNKKTCMCCLCDCMAACRFCSIDFFEYVEHLARNVNTSETRSWFDQTFPTASSVFAATPSRHTATPSLGNRVHWVGALYIVWGFCIMCGALYIVRELFILCGSFVYCVGLSLNAVGKTQ